MKPIEGAAPPSAQPLSPQEQARARRAVLFESTRQRSALAVDAKGIPAARTDPVDPQQRVMAELARILTG